MRQILKLVVATTSLIISALALSHPATERYIPIGESPGISNVKSYIGAIRSIQQTEDGFSMAVEDSDKLIEVTAETKIYLDTGPGKSNRMSTEEDCQIGRVVEVFLHADGTAYWVKISAP